MKQNKYRKYYNEIFKEWLNGDYKDVWDLHGDPSHLKSATRRIIPNPKVMAEKTVNYFVSQKENNIPITYIGVILSCGLRTRASLDKYMKYSEDFKNLIIVIKLVIEENIVQGLYTKDFRASNFLLKTVYSNRYSETVHQIVENKDFKIGVKDPNKK